MPCHDPSQAARRNRRLGWQGHAADLVGVRTQTPTNKKVVFSLAPAKTHRPTRLAALLLLLGLGACANLLPSIQREVTTPWTNFDQAKRSFDQIVPYETR